MKDFIIDDDFDIIISNGDIAVDKSNDQRALLILHTAAGEWKQHPLIGVGINKYLNSSKTGNIINALNSDIRKQIEADGLKIARLRIANDEIDLRVNE